MSSRGSVAVNGHYMNNEYKIIEILQNGEKIIEGLGNNHSMPDYSFSQNSIYIIKKKGEFHAMRIYRKNHEPVIEIAHHPEPRLNKGNRNDDVWHMHKYESKLIRKSAEK